MTRSKNNYIFQNEIEDGRMNNLTTAGKVNDKPIPASEPVAESYTTAKEIEQGKYMNLLYLVNQTKGNLVLIKKMIGLYLKQTPELIDAMKKGIANEDWVIVNTSAHKMIPSFWMMGIDPAMEKIAKIIQEKSSSRKDIGQISQLLLKLEKGCMLACGELEIVSSRLA